MSESPMARRFAALAMVPALLLATAACSDDDEPASTPSSITRPANASPSARQPALEGQISVMAGDAFAGALPELVERFRQDNPGVEVDVRLDPTPVLATDLVNGAAADVFMSADESNMTAVADAGRLDGPPQVLALNRLVIVTPEGNPDDIDAITDLAGAGTVALCRSDLPCGALADTAVAPLGIDGDTDRTDSAADAVDAVRSGRARAALVLQSEAVTAGEGIEVVEATGGFSAAATVATLTPGDNELAARAFVDFVRGPDGLRILEELGFSAPS